MTGEMLEERIDGTKFYVSAVDRSRKNYYNAALTLGRRLIEDRRLIEHGQWLPFLESVGLTPRSAQRYIRLVNAGLSVEDIDRAGGITHALDELSANNDVEGQPKCDSVSHLPDSEPSETEAEDMELRSVIDTRDDQIEHITGHRPPPVRGPSVKDKKIAQLSAQAAEQAALIEDQAALLRQVEAEMDTDGPVINRQRELTAAREELRQVRSRMNRLMTDLASERAARLHRDEAIKRHEAEQGCQISMALPDAPEWSEQWISETIS